MTKSRATILAALLLSASALAAQSGLLQLPINLSSNDSIQRMALPASFMLGARPNEVQIVDATGKAMQMAWLDNTAQAASVTTHAFAPYPILEKSANQATSNLRVVERNGTRTVEWQGTQNAPQPATSQVVGALLDTRNLPADWRASSIGLNADTAAGELQHIVIDTSSNLTDWQTVVSDAVITQLSLPNQTLSQSTVELPNINLHNQYLRISWHTPNAVKMHSANLIGSNQTAQTKHELVRIEPVKNSSNTSSSFGFGQTTHITGIELQSKTNGLVPVQVLGRSAPEAPWQPLASGTVFQLTQNGTTSINGAFVFDATITELRIDALNNTKLPADLTASIRTQPKQLAFIHSGTPPYALHIGANPANIAPLNIAQLMPNYHTGDESALPFASVNANEQTALNHAPAKKSYVLWAVLFAGVFLLAAMVWVILRQMRARG
jgi:hypothetical protein